MANPRELKKFYMKVFEKNEDLYKEFLRLYDEAIKEGSSIPTDLAWIRFKEKYREDDEEGWVEK